ncbi:MAG TPA: radical SAM protein [Rectinemataceae bacterium]|nr:radical SAM protein [Rectinemataceae bacterium]
MAKPEPGPERVLFVRLPCKKVYPLGPIYLMSLVHRARPGLEQRLLDLALVPRAQRTRRLQAEIEAFRPGLVAFSWRDIQIFSPQDSFGALRDAFVFFHDPSPLRKIAAAFRGLWDIITYSSALAHNSGIIGRAVRAHPGLAMALGGPSVRIFGDRLAGRVPKSVRIFADIGLGGFFGLLGIEEPQEEIEPGLDLGYIEEAFPQWPASRGEVIGVQSKRGCPRGCLYCLYGHIEGRTVIRREPARVVDEIADYAERWSTSRIWFADAQLLSEAGDRAHLVAILEGLLARGTKLAWSGYLRIDELDPELASLMVRSGLGELEVSLGSGSQAVVDELNLGVSVEGVLRGCELLAAAGYQGRIFLNLSLNAPGETKESLLETIAAVRRIKAIFGDSRVLPLVFFLAIQPHTGLERRALADGHLKAGYDPLSVMPWNVLRLIYNPRPLGPLIGRACARGFAGDPEGVGERILAYIEAALAKTGGQHG